MPQRPLRLCDLSPLYCEIGGGIRTYHDAKIEWFRRQRDHQYALICPGPRHRVTVLGSNVTVVHVYGPSVSREPGGYRLMLDWRRVRSAIRWLNPDVLEADDPWMSGPYGLFLRRIGAFNGLLASFYHSDPINTYVEPWLRKVIRLRPWGDPVLARIEGLFHRLQSTYDVTLVASQLIEKRLQEQGVTDVIRLPFGVDPCLFDIPPRVGGGNDPRRLLYAGRLDDDKETGLLIDVMSRLLARTDVTLTVIGTGKHKERFAGISHPGFQYLGFVRDRLALRKIYASHDILLAPGRFETFGLAALEAAAAGLVVVGPDAGGTAELLEQMPSPLLFKAGDADAFFGKIREAVDRDLGDLSRAGRMVAAAYGTWPEVVERQVHTYQTRIEAAACGG